MFYYTYILRSLKRGRFYTGYTNNLRKRFKEHNAGKSTYTKSRGPYELIYYETCQNELDVRARELYLKGGKGKRFIKSRLKRFLFAFGMKDITIIYLTASLIPDSFAQYQRNILLEAIEDSPLISVSRKPLNFGTNILDQNAKSESNIYFQMLRAAKIAKTKYIAIAEDDTLYPKEHFNIYRPQDDTFGYNMNRFSLFTWSIPMYSCMHRISNCGLFAPTRLAVDILTERFKKYPNGTPPESTGELGRAEKYLELPIQKVEEFYTEKVSIVQFNHDFASEEYQRLHKKNWGSLRCFDIPHWGKAGDLVKYFK